MFCREALAELAKLRPQVEGQGTQLAFVFMMETGPAGGLFDRFGLADVPRFSDPDCHLYRAFGLKRASIRKFFNPRMWLRGLGAFLRGHRQGWTIGDPLRMPGVFLLHDGKVLRTFRHESPGDRPDYLGLACPISSGGTP